MNLKDTDLENKRKQAIEDLVADATTLAERLLKAEGFGETCRILHNHNYLMEDVLKLIPERKIPSPSKPDRFNEALRAAVLGTLVDILGRAARE